MKNKIFIGVTLFFTNIFNDFRFVDGKKINLQIAKDENAVIIGFPLILTGF